MTTTSDGRTVPYIVRREMGTINRAVYSIAILHEPGTPLPSPWMKGTWNGKLVYTFGGGVAAGAALLEPHVLRVIQSQAMPPFRDVEIVYAHHGEHAGVIGAAALLLS
mgnify:CR=1 FL=1